MRADLEDTRSLESLVLTDDDVTAFMGDDTLLRRENAAAADSLQDDTELETAFTQTSIEPDEPKKYTGYSKNEPVEEDISISLRMSAKDI